MKRLLTVALFISAATAQAQQSKATEKDQSISKCINDDGKKLILSIAATYPDRKVYFTNTYDVAGWNQKEKEELVKRVTDSLGIENRRRTIKL